MGTTIQHLRAIITGDMASFVKMTVDFRAKTSSMSADWTRFAQDATRAATRIATAASAMVGGVAAAGAKMGFEFNAIKEESLIAFETMLGSAVKAKAFMSELTSFAAKTPFELPGLLQNTKQLLAFGFEAHKIIPMLTNIGDAAAGLGGRGETLEYIIRAIGQIQSKGKVSAQEMNQMAEQGIPAWEILAKHLGVTIPEAMKMGEAGMISAATAVPVLLEGMNQKFGGLMDKQSKSMRGMLSTMKDNMRISMGEIFEPLYEQVKRFMSSAMSGTTNAFTGMTSRLQAAVSRIAMVLSDISGSNAGGMELIAQMIYGIADAAVKAAEVFREWYPTIVSTSKALWDMVQPILRYLGEHPQLLAALIALKVAGFLGVTQAIVSFGRAMVTTTVQIGAYIAKLIALRAAQEATAASAARAAAVHGAANVTPLATGGDWLSMLASKGTGGAAANGAAQTAGAAAATGMRAFALAAGLVVAKLAAVVAVTAALGYAQEKAVQYFTGLNKVMAEGEQLTKNRAAQLDIMRDKEMRSMESLAPQEKKLKLEQMLAQEERNRVGLLSQLAAAEKTAKAQSGYLWDSGQARAAKAEAAEIKGRLESQAAYVTSIQQQLGKAEDLIAESAAKGLRRGVEKGLDGASPPSLGSPVAADEAAKAEKEKQEDAQKEAEDRVKKSGRALSDFLESIKEMKGVIPEAELATFLNRFAELKKQFDAGAISAEEFEGGVRSLEGALGDTASFKDKMKSLGGELSDAQAETFKGTFNRLRDDLVSGKISQGEYKSGMRGLNDSIEGAQRFNSNDESFRAKRDQQIDRVREAGAEKYFDVARVAGYQRQFNTLNEQLQSGTISAKQFATATSALDRQMDAAADAAIKQKNAEERKRLASGKFTKEEVQKAVEDRKIQIQQSKFDQYIDRLMGGIQGVGDGMTNLSGGFVGLGDQISKFGGNLKNAGSSASNSAHQSEISAEEAQQRFGAYFDWLNSAQGQIQTLQWNMAMLWQRFQFLSGGPEKWVDIPNAIAAIQQQIDALSQRRPILLPSYGPTFVDPGLMTGGQQTNNISVTLPNMRNPDAQTAAALADAIQLEMQRRGRRFFA